MVKSKTPLRKVWFANISDRTQYYSSEFKKMRCEIQECGNYQPCRIFIENTLAAELTMSSVKIQAAIYRDKMSYWQESRI